VPGSRSFGCGSSFVRSRTGQFSLEIVLLFGFFVILFTGVLIIVTQRSAEVDKENTQIAAADVVNILTREIRYSYIAGEGYERNFILPYTIRGVNYSITIIDFTAEAAQGLDEGGPQAAMMYLNTSTLQAPSMMPLPYKVLIAYCPRQDALLYHASFKVTLEMPLWTKPSSVTGPLVPCRT
jgi:hypothetical protein